MYIFFKLITAAVSYFVYLKEYYKRTPVYLNHFKDTSFYIIHYKVKIHTTLGADLAVKSPVNFNFNLSKKKWFDKLFIRLNYTIDFKTMDLDFDKNIYVECDVNEFKEFLINCPNARKVVKELLKLDISSISSNGKFIYLYNLSKHIKFESYVDLLHQLSVEIEGYYNEKKENFKDQFFLKERRSSALLISICAYGISGFFMSGLLQVNKLNLMDQTNGVFASLFLLLAFFIVNYYLLKGSTRAHRVIFNKIIYVGLGFLMLGIYLKTDLLLIQDLLKRVFN